MPPSRAPGGRRRIALEGSPGLSVWQNVVTAHGVIDPTADRAGNSARRHNIPRGTT